MNKEVAKKEWFNAAQFPKATFVSTAIKPAGAGKLNVAGKLTIKGKTADVNFPLTVKTEGGKQVFEGQLPIKRLALTSAKASGKTPAWSPTTLSSSSASARENNHPALIHPTKDNHEIQASDRRHCLLPAPASPARQSIPIKSIPNHTYPSFEADHMGIVGLARQVHQDRGTDHARPRRQNR
jgi:hypothetical protein